MRVTTRPIERRDPVATGEDHWAGMAMAVNAVLLSKQRRIAPRGVLLV